MIDEHHSWKPEHDWPALTIDMNICADGYSMRHPLISLSNLHDLRANQEKRKLYDILFNYLMGNEAENFRIHKKIERKLSVIV